MAESTSFRVVTTPTQPIDCACVIHGDVYPWSYVEKLYNMLNRNITPGINLHVYTEESRPVPQHMIKHNLINWDICGPKQSWWYKMQLFNPDNHAGSLLYFDLDVVITGNLDWITELSTKRLWAIRDFKYLWRPSHQGINSSIMWWDTVGYSYVWDEFTKGDIQANIKKYTGDQDFISDIIPINYRRFFDSDRIKSWRWQALDGGFNFQSRKHYTPGSGTELDADTSVLVFHGRPKPHQVQDFLIAKFWQ